MGLIWGLLALGAVALLAGRLRDLSDGRRLWRGGDDPTFQGDGWRWTLSLLLPNLLLWSSPLRNDRWAGTPVRAPFTLDMLVLTKLQKRACFAEFWQAQLDQQDRPLERWETIEREERDG